MKKFLVFLWKTLIVLLTTILMIIILIYSVVAVGIKGPSPKIRELLTMSLYEASFTKLLLPLWISNNELNEIIESNQIKETEENTDTSLVVIEEELPTDNNGYLVETSYDKEIVVKDGMEMHYITGSTWTGIMLIVKDPSRVFVGTSKDVYDGSNGISVPNIAKRYDAQVAINGAFFEDTGGVGNGGTPLGFVFSKGNQLWGGDDTTFKLIGFDENNVLICGNMTGLQAKEKHIRDAVSCKPYLVINGEAVDSSGSGSGLNPRTAFGQRSDGAVLLLIIDGRQTHSLGASLKDLSQVMLAFGAVNAGNLDGGGSTALYYDGEILNNCTSIYGMRGIPDAICVAREDLNGK